MGAFKDRFKTHFHKSGLICTCVGRYMYIGMVCVCICGMYTSVYVLYIIMYVYMCVFKTLLVLTTPYAVIKALMHIPCINTYIHNHVTENYFMLCLIITHTYVIVTVVRTAWSFYL